MVRFWVGFALFIAAVAVVAHFLGVSGDPLRAAFDRGRMTSARSAEHVSSEVATQARQVGEFTRIHAEGASVIEVEVREGLGLSVEIKTDENLLPAVHTEVVEGILEISPDAGFKPLGDLHIKVTAPALAGIHLEGANKLTLTIDSRAAIDLHSEGAVRIRAAGRVDALTVRGEGASAVDARELVARSVDVRLEGAGRATVHATERLKARIEGAGVVRYAGNPSNVDKDVDGIGHVSRIE